MARIEDYALIGDCETAALVGRDGSIDWLCWPRFDSDACFCALLGGPEHGRWLLAPQAEPTRVTRRYREDTLVLETDFETEGGAVTVIDFMPVRGERSDLVRIARCQRGRVRMHTELALRFDYGAAVPWVSHDDDRSVRAVAGPDLVALSASVPIRSEGSTVLCAFDLAAGDEASFVLGYSPSHLPVPHLIEPQAALDNTTAFWREWAGRCSYRGEWAGAVKRSLITLKALTYAPTGALVAAPTTSLPEWLGGARNWDYRYCWLRDATLTLLALLDAGYHEEAQAFREWLLRAAAGSPAHLQIMYGIGGERRLPELELDWLPGYRGSRPVRIGNAASAQVQLDVYGELMDTMHQARRAGLVATDPGWALQRALVEHLERIWQEPDDGIWEVRGGRRHFTHSKIMAWVAFDRTIRSAEELGLDGPLLHWRAVRDRIHREVCARGYDEATGTFVQSYGGTSLDASLLLIPIVGFLPADDPRVLRTVSAIERKLTSHGLVLRYDTSATQDGLPPCEGTFLACSFWLADNWLLQGRVAEARALFQRLLALRNDVGLLSEEYEPRGERMLGNFPQALAHLALVSTALNLARGDKPAEQRA